MIRCSRKNNIVVPLLWSRTASKCILRSRRFDSFGTVLRGSFSLVSYIVVWKLLGSWRSFDCTHHDMSRRLYPYLSHLFSSPNPSSLCQVSSVLTFYDLNSYLSGIDEPNSELLSSESSGPAHPNSIGFIRIRVIEVVLKPLHQDFRDFRGIIATSCWSMSLAVVYRKKLLNFCLKWKAIA